MKTENQSNTVMLITFCLNNYNHQKIKNLSIGRAMYVQEICRLCGLGILKFNIIGAEEFL